MPGPVKAAVAKEYITNQTVHKPHSSNSSSSSHSHCQSLGQIAATCLEISFGAMPVSYKQGRGSKSSSTKETHFDSHEFLAKLAHIVLRARIPSDQLHSQPLVSTNLVDAWTSGWPVHIDIYKEDTLLERWITCLDTSDSHNRHGTHQHDFILILQSIYAHTRLMPIHPLLMSNALSKDQLSFSVTCSDSPSSSPTTIPAIERREFKSHAQLKVFQFQRVHMTQLGTIQLEVVFDENVGDQKSLESIEQRIGSLQLEHAPTSLDTTPSSPNPLEQINTTPPKDYFGIPIPEASSKRKATSPFPSPGQSQRMVHRSLHRHAASHLARQHAKPVVQLTFSPPQSQDTLPQTSPSPASSNLANLFSQQKSSPPVDASPVHPLQPHGSPICSTSSPDIPLSPPRSATFVMPMAQSSIARRRLSRLSISAMEQEYQDPLLEDEDTNIPLATSPSMQYTHQGRTVAYSTSPSSHHTDSLLHHTKHLHAPRRSSLVHASPMFTSRRNSLGLPHGELFGSLVGSYEESILNGRMSTLPSKPITFHAQIGVLGHGPCKPSLRCPPHATLVFPSFFYELEDTDLPTPYVGTIDLEGGLTDERFKRKPGHYRLPPKGQLQIVIKNPNKTAVKLFLVPYDLCDMPAGTKTFLRQKSFGDEESRGTLRYAIHVQVCCSEKNHLYLFKHIRVVFANRASNEKLRVVCEDPGVPKYVPLTEPSAKR
ncbi:hypothetical protein Unana1_03835 [Umbelopsis nana]